MGCRGVGRVLALLADKLGLRKVPHHTTIRQWVLKRGYHQVVHQTVQKAKDWGAIFDLTVDVGALKCLLVLGVRLKSLLARDDFTLSHHDTQVLGIYFNTKSTGDFVYESLKNAEKKIGHPFASLLLDQGSDVTKGANIYRENSKNTIVVHDVSHKIAIVLEKHLKSDPFWRVFCDHITATKLAVQQTTDLAALMPPKLRSKARYMSADVLMNWITRFQESKQLGHMNSINPERRKKYFGWIDSLTIHIDCWKQMFSIGEDIKKLVSSEGFSLGTYLKLEDFLNTEFLYAVPKVIDFIDDAMNAIWDEVELLKPEQIVPGDGRVIESIFGKFKQSASSQLHGITIGALGIATFMSSNEIEDVKRAMENTTMAQVIKWGREYIGSSVASMRRKFFPHKKRNENSEIFIEESYA